MHESLDEFEFRQFATELRPLIDVRIEFLLNILKTNRPIKTICIHIIIDKGRTGLMVRASDSGSGDPGSILGRVGVFVSLSKRHLLPKSTGNTQE